MAGKFGGRGNVAKRESKIKLVELGPRLRLRLYKVERGVCSGDVLYHAFREDPGEASGDDLFADDDSDAPPPKKRKGSKRPPF